MDVCVFVWLSGSSRGKRWEERETGWGRKRRERAVCMCSALEQGCRGAMALQPGNGPLG